MAKKLFIDALSRDHLLALFRDALQFRQELEPEDLHILNESVRDFLARNAGPLCALLNNPGFTDRHAVLTRELLERAHALAPGPAERSWVEGQALKVGFEDLFPAEKLSRATLTESQARAFEQLRAMAILHFRASKESCIQFRTTPLLLGPSGVGKTHLVERLGRVLRLEVIRVTVGDWMVTGSRAEPHTLTQIRNRLKGTMKFILHIDELDKFRDNRDAWSQAQMTEIFNVLDRRIAGGMWSDADCQKLKQDVFIIGSGTFQDVWREQETKPLGFAAPVANSEFDLTGKIRKAQVIPAELLNRFNSEWLVLDPFGVSDFEGIAREFKIAPDVLDPVAAAESGLNFRAVENALTVSALKGIRQEIKEGFSLNTPSQ